MGVVTVSPDKGQSETPTSCWMTPAAAPDVRGVRPVRAGADRETLIRNLVDGQFDHPVRIVAFTFEGWSRDVTVEIADE